MNIVAVLQNQWFKNPETARATYAQFPSLKDRARLNEKFLFWASVTGKRLTKAFGDRCDDIIWENASTFIGGQSDSKAEADPEHLQAVFDYWKPDIVLAFGKIAQEGILEVTTLDNGPIVIGGPHPAARQRGTLQALGTMSKHLEAILKAKGEGNAK